MGGMGEFLVPLVLYSVNIGPPLYPTGSLSVAEVLFLPGSDCAM
jgi:hypothetical protein